MSDKEREDGIVFNSLDKEYIRKEFAVWDTVRRRDPNYVAFEIPVTVPEVCSDGVVRTPEEYVLFTSGKTLDQHIQELRNYARLNQFITINIVYNETLYQGMFRIIRN